jgi:hypothetical protein
MGEDRPGLYSIRYLRSQLPGSSAMTLNENDCRESELHALGTAQAKPRCSIRFELTVVSAAEPERGGRCGTRRRRG